MKFSTFIIIVLLGVIAWLLARERVNWEALKDAGVRSSKTIAARVQSNEATKSAKTGPSVRMDVSAPVPEVHATNAMTVRGQVIGVQDQFAVVDCDYRVKLSEEELANLKRTGNPNLISLLQEEEERKVFGALKMVDERGQQSVVEFKPRQNATGTVFLTGLPLRTGDFVHVISAPIGKHPSGMPIYAARMKLMGGAWMWNNQQGRTLDQPAR